MAKEKILLGQGIFTINATPVGMTRGGGEFVVEREYRTIEADGDMGDYVKDRIVIDKENAKLTVNGLDLFDTAKLQSYYPAIDITDGVMTSTLTIASGDFVTVKWTGKTLDGSAVTIEIDNAINLGNIEWKLEDKNEVVPEHEFNASYVDGAMDTAPWNVTFA